MSSSYPAHEGLQVAPDGSGDPEVYYGDDAPEVVPADPQKYMKFDDRPPLSNASTGRWCGMRRSRAVMVAIAVVLIIGAVVGGAVGGIQARNNGSSSGSSSSTSTSTTASASKSASRTASTTSTTAFAVPTSGILALNCPAINNTQYTSQAGSSSYSFELYCLVDFASSVSNIGESLESSLDSCVDSCATYNNANKSPPCQGLTFDANLTAYKDANCFLKTSITKKVPYTEDKEQASALLLN